MANTVIQIKYSDANSAPTRLNVAEPAYSYVSNTFFIGTPDGTGAMIIGGQAYINYANSAFSHANGAFNAANSATVITTINGGAF
jgi:hypothetical protein